MSRGRGRGRGRADGGGDVGGQSPRPPLPPPKHGLPGTPPPAMGSGGHLSHSHPQKMGVTPPLRSSPVAAIPGPTPSGGGVLTPVREKNTEKTTSSGCYGRQVTLPDGALWRPRRQKKWCCAPARISCGAGGCPKQVCGSTSPLPRDRSRGGGVPCLAPRPVVSGGAEATQPRLLRAVAGRQQRSPHGNTY